MNPLRLIVGLGNPGEQYTYTRHNLGFLVVLAFAQKLGWEFKQDRRLRSLVADGHVENGPLQLLLPMTYMNLSGEAIRKKMAVKKIPLADLLVVVDDVHLPFGAMRLRSLGGTGGHKGLLSIENQLHSQEYARLRMGVGPKEKELLPEKLEGYVLARFNSEEMSALPQFLERGVSVLDCWIRQGIETAIRMAGELK